MDRVPARGLVIVAAAQVAVALAALLYSSLTAVAAAAAVGVLAVGRYLSLSLFAHTMAPGSDGRLRLIATSAWALGFIALLAAVAATAVRFRPALPWAVAAAFCGPIAISILALGAGVGALVGGRRRGEGRAVALRGGER